MIAMGLALGVFNLLARLNRPLIDAQLLAIDLRFAFRLARLYRMERGIRLLIFSRCLLQSFGMKGIALLCLLFLYNEAGQAQRYLIVMFFKRLACTLIGAWFHCTELYYSLPREACTHLQLPARLSCIFMRSCSCASPPDRD